MSRKGNCIDNCIMESFFSTLKNEMFYVHESEFKTYSDLHRAIDKYINYYNNERIKNKTKWMPLLNLGRHPCKAYDIIQLTCPVYWAHIIFSYCTESNLFKLIINSKIIQKRFIFILCC